MNRPDPGMEPETKGVTMLGKYTKAILGTLAALATWGVTAGVDGHYDQVELWGALGVVVAAVTIAGSTNTES